MALSGQGCAKCWVTGGYLIAVAFTVQRLWINWGHHFWEAKVPWPPRAQVCVRRAFVKQQPGLWKGKNNQTKRQAPAALQLIVGSLPLKGMGRGRTTASNWGKKLGKAWWESGLLCCAGDRSEGRILAGSPQPPLLCACKPCAFRQRCWWQLPLPSRLGILLAVPSQAVLCQSHHGYSDPRGKGSGIQDIHTNLQGEHPEIHWNLGRVPRLALFCFCPFSIILHLLKCME